MCVLLVLALLLALAATALSVDVPYKSCGSGHLTIDTVQADVWPPVKGQDLLLNVTGSLDEDITSGKYSIAIKVDGFPLPVITGSISDFKPLPWTKGPFNFTYGPNIPSAAPSGSYTLQLTAVDQSSSSILCIDMSFKLKMTDGDSDSVSMGASLKVSERVSEVMNVRRHVRNAVNRIPKIPALTNRFKPVR